MQNSATLTAKYSAIHGLTFKENASGLTIIEIMTSLCEAKIALQGAQVMTWTPNVPAAKQHPVIWLSPDYKLAPGKSIRGGVPICWPWFGSHATQSSYPSHGFARTVHWDVIAIDAINTGAICLQFRLCHDANSLAQWPHKTPVVCKITVGATLQVELITGNESAVPVQISEALHTYLAVGDVRKTQVTGLENAEYIDKVDGGKRKQHSGAIGIDKEVDRVYLNTENECVVNDAAWRRRIRIKKRNSKSTIVWNPWIEKAEKMGDLGKDGYLGMLCVESGNALENAIQIPPGGEHSLWVSYEVESI